MTGFGFSLLVFFVSVCCWAESKLPSAQPTYITRYDYLDVDKVLSNERILRRLMDCIMDRGPCTREGKELKRIIPDALRTNCSKCNRRQKMNTGKALAYILHYKPEYWFQILNKFDHDGSFRRKLNIDPDEGSQHTVLRRRTRSIPTIVKSLHQGYQKIQKIKKLKQIQKLKFQVLFS